MKHHILMLAACLLPLALLLSLSSMGIESNVLFILLLIGCVAMHFWTMKGHGDGTKGKGDGHE